MKYNGLGVVFGMISALAAMPPLAAGAAEDLAAEYRRFCEALRQDKSLLRLYTFEGEFDPAQPIPSAMGAGGELTYQAAPPKGTASQKPQRVEGRWPGKWAVRLDAGCLVGPTPELAKAFTVAVWVRVHGAGAHPGGGGATNGTLLALGNGYWDGFRVTTSLPSGSIGFEIGRPQPSHAIGVRTGPMSHGLWHHTVATWDGRRMCVFVDGIIAASGVYEGGLTAPNYKNAFRVGYANAGVGSVNLDVDEVAVFGRALGADEIARHACFPATMPAEAAARFRQADQLWQQKDMAGAAREWEAIAAMPELRGEIVALARLQRASALVANKQPVAANGEVLKLVQMANLPERYRALAIASLGKLLREAPTGALPPAVVEPLVALPQIGAMEKLNLRLAAGNYLAAKGEHEAARGEYRKLLAQPDVPAYVRALTQLRIAQSHVSQRDSAGARKEYSKLAEMADAPAHYRWEAQQQLKAMSRVDAGQSPYDPAASRIKLPAQPEPVGQFYVAPNGSDRNCGTEQRPFATLQRARDELRRGGSAAVKGAWVINVRGGRYIVTQTLKLDAQDSGTPTSPIIYRAVDGETPIFTGGVRLTGFQPVTDPALLARLPEESRGKVVQVDLKGHGLANLKPLVLGGYGSGRGFMTHPVMELFFDGKAMPMSRWPNEGFVKVADVSAEKPIGKKGLSGSAAGIFQYEGDRPSRWLGDAEAWLYGYWWIGWADSYEKIAGIDPKTRTITLVPPLHTRGFRKGEPFCAVHVFAEIDAPGEWYIDRTAGVLYFYPPSDPAKAAVELSTFQSPMLQLENVSHVTFQGLTFELGCGDGVIVRGGESCLLAGVIVRRFGGDGVIVKDGRRNGLLSCDIHSMGRGGVSVSGGDRKTLEPAGHFIENCEIYDLSRIDHTYTPAILVSGVGNRIAHNLLHDIRSSAIRLGGNDHIVECNEVHNVVTESDDQGGVDMWGNPTYRGNVFRYNYWHHIGNWRDPAAGPLCGHAGIRFDDAISEQLVYGNVFYRCAAGRSGFGGVQIHGGKENVLDNNVFIDCATAVSFSPWSEARWREFVANSMKAREIDPALYVQRYPLLGRLEADANVNLLSRNLVHGCGEFLRRDRGQNLLLDNRMAEGDAPVAKIVADAPRAGLAPIPFDQIGLYVDTFRKTRPAAKGQ